MKLVYSRTHTCHGRPMIWQPAGRHFYCVTCHRKEGPNQYGVMAQPKADPILAAIPATEKEPA